MSVRQRRQLNRVVDSVSRLVPELSPRVIEPDEDKQRELGIAEQMLLIRVGTHRMIALSPQESGNWTIMELDSQTGDLVLLWGETGPLDDDQLGPIILSAAIGSLEEQLAMDGEIQVHEDMRPVLTAQVAVLQQRLGMVTGSEPAGAHAAESAPEIVEADETVDAPAELESAVN